MLDRVFGVGPKRQPPCLYFDRAAGGDRHYRHPGGDAAAGLEQGQAEGPGDILHEQSQTVDAGMDHV